MIALSVSVRKVLILLSFINNLYQNLAFFRLSTDRPVRQNIHRMLPAGLPNSTIVELRKLVDCDYTVCRLVPITPARAWEHAETYREWLTFPNNLRPPAEILLE